VTFDDQVKALLHPKLYEEVACESLGADCLVEIDGWEVLPLKKSYDPQVVPFPLISKLSVVHRYADPLPSSSDATLNWRYYVDLELRLENHVPRLQESVIKERLVEASKDLKNRPFVAKRGCYLNFYSDINPIGDQWCVKSLDKEVNSVEELVQLERELSGSEMVVLSDCESKFKEYASLHRQQWAPRSIEGEAPPRASMKMKNSFLVARIIGKTRLGYYGKDGQDNKYPFHFSLRIIDISKHEVEITFWGATAPLFYTSLNCGSIVKIGGLRLRERFHGLPAQMRSLISGELISPSFEITYDPPYTKPSHTSSTNQARNINTNGTNAPNPSTSGAQQDKPAPPNSPVSCFVLKGAASDWFDDVIPRLPLPISLSKVRESVQPPTPTEPITQVPSSSTDSASSSPSKTTAKATTETHTGQEDSEKMNTRTLSPSKATASSKPASNVDTSEDNTIKSAKATAQPEVPAKRGRGRPKKNAASPSQPSKASTPSVKGQKASTDDVSSTTISPDQPVKRGRGRPKKSASAPITTSPVKRGRGRPKKNASTPAPTAESYGTQPTDSQEVGSRSSSKKEIRVLRASQPPRSTSYWGTASRRVDPRMRNPPRNSQEVTADEEDETDDETATSSDSDSESSSGSDYEKHSGSDTDKMDIDIDDKGDTKDHKDGHHEGDTDVNIDHISYTENELKKSNMIESARVKAEEDDSGEESSQLRDLESTKPSAGSSLAFQLPQKQEMLSFVDCLQREERLAPLYSTCGIVWWVGQVERLPLAYDETGKVATSFILTRWILIRSEKESMLLQLSCNEEVNHFMSVRHGSKFLVFNIRAGLHHDALIGVATSYTEFMAVTDWTEVFSDEMLSDLPNESPGPFVGDSLFPVSLPFTLPENYAKVYRASYVPFETVQLQASWEKLGGCRRTDILIKGFLRRLVPIHEGDLKFSLTGILDYENLRATEKVVLPRKSNERYNYLWVVFQSKSGNDPQATYVGALIPYAPAHLWVMDPSELQIDWMNARKSRDLVTRLKRQWIGTSAKAPQSKYIAAITIQNRASRHLFMLGGAWKDPDV
jgi:hypothetical protein